MTEDYFANPAMNASSIKQGQISMAHMHASMHREPKPITTPLRMGTYFHAALLEPETFKALARPVELRGAGKDGGNTTKNSKQWKEHEELYGEWAMTQAELEMVMPMVESAWNYAPARNLMSDIQEVEIELYWDDPICGPSKARLDARTHCAILEAKSAANASQFGFFKSAENLGYRLAAAWYCRGARTLGKPHRLFKYLVVEKRPPYSVAVYDVGSALMAEAEKDAVNIGEEYRACEKRGIFPDIQKEEESFERPRWATSTEDTWTPGEEADTTADW